MLTMALSWGELLRAMREGRRLSQQVLAARAGVSLSTLQKMERPSDVPWTFRDSTVLRVVRAFGELTTTEKIHLCHLLSLDPNQLTPVLAGHKSLEAAVADSSQHYDEDFVYDDLEDDPEYVDPATFERLAARPPETPLTPELRRLYDELITRVGPAQTLALIEAILAPIRAAQAAASGRAVTESPPVRPDLTLREPPRQTRAGEIPVIEERHVHYERVPQPDKPPHQVPLDLPKPKARKKRPG